MATVGVLRHGISLGGLMLRHGIYSVRVIRYAEHSIRSSGGHPSRYRASPDS